MKSIYLKGLKASYTIGELENLTEAELEVLILERNLNDARYVLGKLQLEGSSDKVSRNDKKGVNWLKEAIKNNHH